MSVLFENRARLEELTFILHPPLPIVVGYTAVLGGMSNSDCGLSFSHSGDGMAGYQCN